jgi:hypothetical protein
VFLKAPTGHWYAIKADLKVRHNTHCKVHLGLGSDWQPMCLLPAMSIRQAVIGVTQAAGFLLLRDEADGSMHYLPPDDSGRLMQVNTASNARNLACLLSCQ